MLKLLIVTLLLCNVSCTYYAQDFKKNLPMHNHVQDYRTHAQSVSKMPPSKEYQYDDQYAIPDIESNGFAFVNADALMIPPGSKH